MAGKPTVKVSANFERNLAEIERFLAEAEAAQAFDALLAELLDAVIPNLEQFPAMGRPLLQRNVGSVEATNAQASLKAKLGALTNDANAIREYVLKHHLMLYAAIGETFYLLAIRHQRQLSFDLAGHWST